MIDPITALAGIQSAVALIKKVSKTVDDVSSLGPVLGKYFDAKQTATKAAHQAKASGKKSSMATAIEIEMALEQTAQFEKELQMLFMQTGKIDVWNKIKKRAKDMDDDNALQERKAKHAAMKRTQQMKERFEIFVAIVLVVFIAIGLTWGIIELIQFCTQYGCGR